MAIKGALETVSANGVSGWCVDDASEEPISVEIRVGSCVIGSVRADIPRQDIRQSLGRHLAGFRFPFSPALFRLLPHRARVDALAKGKELSVMKDRPACIDNPAQEDERQLLEMLDDGYIIGAKGGQIFRPLKGTHLEEGAFRALERGNEIFKQLFSKEFFICYGTLLGCIRDHDFIEHDDDVDVCFLAKGASLQDATQEFLDMVQALRSRGEVISVQSNIQFHWRLGGIEIDVFMAWLEGDRLYCYNVGGELSHEQIYPLVHHNFKGRDVLIPRDSTAVLELIYGPGWRTPDRQFQWRPSPEARAKMREIDSIALDHQSTLEQIKQHWVSFYESSRTTIPSPFAASVAVELPESCGVVDIGCGNARDSAFFARLGHRVLGLDIAEAVIGENQMRARKQGLRGLAFEQADIAQPDVLAKALLTFFSSAPRDGVDTAAVSLAIYARFLLHAITPDEEATLLNILSTHLAPGIPCFFEFRTERDADIRKQFGEHYRRYINVEDFVDRATANTGFECVYKMEGQGMAKFRHEDPVVGRVHLRRR